MNFVNVSVCNTTNACNFENHFTCYICVAASDAQFVTLQFDFFEVAQGDNVTIYNGNTIAAPVIAVLNGTYQTPPGGWTTTQRNMLIRLLTDGSNNARGFAGMARSLASGRYSRLSSVCSRLQPKPPD